MRAVITLLPLVCLIAGCDRQSASAPQANATGTEATITQPEVAGTLDLSKRGSAAPADSFIGPNGQATTIAAFAGKPVIVNLWATWCGPCVKELPSLDRLAARGGDKIVVLTVSQDDPKDQAKDPVPDWWAAHPLPHLALYRDNPNALGFAYATEMLPTTVLYDAKGKEVWRVVGSMDWDGPRANTLLAEVLG